MDLTLLWFYDVCCCELWRDRDSKHFGFCKMLEEISMSSILLSPISNALLVAKCNRSTGPCHKHKQIQIRTGTGIDRASATINNNIEPEETTRNTGYHGDYYYLEVRSKKWAIPKGDDGDQRATSSCVRGRINHGVIPIPWLLLDTCEHEG